MKKTRILNSLLSALMTISVISTTTIPVVAEEAAGTEPEEPVEIVENENTGDSETEDVEIGAEEESEDFEIDIFVEDEESAGSGVLSYEGNAEELIVTAETAENVFPEGTEMAVDAVTEDSVLGLIKDTVGENAEVLAAVDITFTDAEGAIVQPTGGEVRVAFENAGIAYSDNLKLVHVDNRSEELTATVLDTELVETENGGIAFDADSFSIYAIVDEGQEPDSRLVVNFYNGDSVIKEYVNKTDYEKDPTLATVIYDPGVGDMTANEFFRGWAKVKEYDKDTQAITINTIREEVATKLSGGVTDGEEVSYYAIIFKSFTITYEDQRGAVTKTDTVLIPRTYNAETGAYSYTENAKYTINYSYVPENQNQAFEGWIDKSDETTVYQVGDELDLTDKDYHFKAKVKTGHWLIFETVKKGASYVPAEFLDLNTATSEPDSEPTLYGYIFDGWYTQEVGGSLYQFGNTIGEHTTVYAHWSEKLTANYTVIIWKQNIAGDGYDYERAIQLSGNVGDDINTVSQQGTGNNAYARINGQNYQYTGFHLKEFDQNVKIATEGNSAVNVYYDRNEYTLNFQDHPYTVTTSGSGTQYALIDGQYVELTRYGNNNYWYNGARYYGTRYTQGSGWVTVKEIKALYQQNISSNFPIVGSNGATYNHGERWDPQSTTPYSEVLIFIDVMPASNVTFHLDIASHSTKTIHYYVEALQGQAAERTYNGMGFVLYKSIDANYNWFTQAEDYIDLVGFTKGGNTYPPEAYNSNGGKLNSVWNNSSARNVYCYYTRNVYSINFMDGTYYDGDDKEKTDVTDMKQIKEEKNIDYQSDISSYNNYTVTSVNPGYLFEGWYIDKECKHEYTFTTMPEGGVTVYAKWRLKQYRVFLHPNAEEEPPLTGYKKGYSIGADKQETSFRVDYGEKVGKFTTIADDYTLIGWYFDEGFTKPFDFDVFVANDQTVDTPYDQTQSTELDKYGNVKENTNSDSIKGRTWITKKLNLYARWRANLDNADGIEVHYYTDIASDTPYAVDPKLYLDNTDAIAWAAPSAEDVPEGKVFAGWVVQTWNGNDFEDTGVNVVPGDSYNIKKNMARFIKNPNVDTDPTAKNQYIVRVRAEFKDLEESTKVTVTYNANGGNINGIIDNGTATGDNVSNKDKYTFEIDLNKDFVLPGSDKVTLDGFTFAGWAFTNDATEPAIVNGKEFVGGLKVAADHLDRDSDNNWDPNENTLYAVWRNVSYIRHSSAIGDKVKEIQKVVVTPKGITIEKKDSDNTEFREGATTINLVDEVLDDYLYGGYYYNTEKSSPYNGENDYWTYSVTVDGTVPEHNYYEKPGNNLTPENGVTYFLKEVPDYYLTPRIQYFYSIHNNNTLTRLYVVSAVDDGNYEYFGFDRTTAQSETIDGKTVNYNTAVIPLEAKLAEEVSFKASNEDRYGAADVTKAFRGDRTFVGKGGVMYVAVPDLKKAGTLFNYVAHLKTYDGINVYGNTLWTIYTGDGKYYSSGKAGLQLLKADSSYDKSTLSTNQ